ncbi:AfsR/SARP family transcriptional regulator [Amycolatopsis vancoresmycina]|uniref:SARP family transcriptional regulator n=1 Tax=Amycolatopsis vancoresmycina DSM 44592 TaxID=1292037 RepID=R1GFI0_9PSEU|nr:BTAD domain-containing putative transcriptional regulator [Amycolatopsis vancoresmycina]EOD70027.1 SARP family transcriptional regulator [Amycolatopsis vancoresmycina DSM 44592]
MDFRLLGPLTVVVDGAPVPLGGPKPRSLLAMLVLNAGRVVAGDALVTALWGDEAPDSARAMLHTYVSTLRRTLAGAASGELLVRQAPGYLLRADPQSIDLTRFERAVLAGRQALDGGDPELASSTLAAALALWTGEPLGGVRGEWAERARVTLAEARLDALEARLTADFRSGRGRTLVGELTALVGEHPLREPLRALLVLALHEAGRQADALETFHQARRLLDDELGVAPGPELQAAFRTVLGEPAAAVAGERAPAVVAVPRQLPPAIAGFTGRQDELRRVVGALQPAGPAATRICAISGKPGSGKTTLAVHAAHRVRPDYPDGQLYADLGGPHPRPVDPAEVLVRFLRSLGVADASIPAADGERADLYRSLLADRRVLVVLDNAFDEQQVRPLVPAGTGCAVVVTGRARLATLAGASLLDLRELPEPEALALLAVLVPDGRLRDDPEAARKIVRLCGHLPLAVRIAGARLAARPHWTTGALVRRLSRQGHLLDELAIGDLEVRRSLALSYEALAGPERTALRRLALLGVPEFASWLAAPLLDVPLRAADAVVERLVDAQLLDATGAGPARFRFHDLTRAFAGELVTADPDRAGTRAALERVCRAGLELLRRAASRPPGVLEPPAGIGHLDAATVTELLAEPGGWCEREHALLANLVELAGELDLVELATALAVELSTSSYAVHNRFGHWRRSHTAALAAARRTGDRASEALLLVGVGRLYYEQDRFDEAVSHFAQALTAYHDLGDAGAEARTRLELSFVLRERGRYADAEAALTRAMPVLRSTGTADEQAMADHNLGMLRTEQGRLAEAAELTGAAMSAWRSIGNRRAAALAQRSLGIVHRAAGRLDEAADCCARAVADLRLADARLMTAYAEQALAKVRIRQGRGREVRHVLDAALTTCNELADGFGQALVLRTLGELELAGGDLDAATRYLTRSLEWWQALDLPVWQARTSRDLAAAVAGLGDDRRAAELRATALAIFERSGCREAAEPLPSPSMPRL